MWGRNMSAYANPTSVDFADFLATVWELVDVCAICVAFKSACCSIQSRTDRLVYENPSSESFWQKDNHLFMLRT